MAGHERPVVRVDYGDGRSADLLLTSDPRHINQLIGSTSRPTEPRELNTGPRQMSASARIA